VLKNELKRRLAYSAFALVRSPLPLYQATSEVAAWVAAQGILSPHVVANVTALLEGFGATALSDLAELNEEERAALLAAVPRLKQKAFLERIASVPAVAAKVLRVLLPSSLPLSPFRLQKINTMRSCLNSPPPLCALSSFMSKHRRRPPPRRYTISRHTHSRSQTHYSVHGPRFWLTLARLLILTPAFICFCSRRSLLALTCMANSHAPALIFLSF